MVEVLGVAAGISGLISVVAIGLGWFLLWPHDAFDTLSALQDRMDELEAQQPRYQQELQKFTVATQEILEAADHKLKRAVGGRGGRPRKDADANGASAEPVPTYPGSDVPLHRLPGGRRGIT